MQAKHLPTQKIKIIKISKKPFPLSIYKTFSKNFHQKPMYREKTYTKVLNATLMVPDFSLPDYNSIQGISRATSDTFYQMKKQKGKKISKQAFLLQLVYTARAQMSHCACPLQSQYSPQPCPTFWESRGKPTLCSHHQVFSSEYLSFSWPSILNIFNKISNSTSLYQLVLKFSSVSKSQTLVWPVSGSLKVLENSCNCWD